MEDFLTSQVGAMYLNFRVGICTAHIVTGSKGSAGIGIRGSYLAPAWHNLFKGLCTGMGSGE